VSTRAAVHWLEYAFFTVVKWKLRYLPEGMALGFGAALGWFVGRILGVRHDVAESNLQSAFPGESAEWRDRVVAASYSHLGREAVAMLRMGWMTPQEIVTRTTVEGFEAFQEALSEGRGVILATGHLGSWEAGGAYLAARGVPLDGVTKAMSNERFGRALTATRERLGYGNIDVSDAPRAVPRSLKQGRVVALLGDQNVRRGGVFVPFFGRPAATARGVATFALRTGAPIFLGVAVHEAGRPHRYRGILQRIPVEPTGDAEVDIWRITAAHTAALERLVRRFPEQYFWQHKRWDTRPAGGESPEPPPGGMV
jgi:KDO2-lipid IV(A) lauroyltransferase